MIRPSIPCALALSLALAACGGGGGGGSAEVVVPPSPPVNGPAWWGFGRDAQHSAQAGGATQPLSRIVWQTKVDLMPRYTTSGALHIHYGSPVITARNTVVVPVKTGPTGGFSVDARSGGNGALLWSAASDYILPAHDWTPSFNVALTPGNRLYMPGAGGKLYYRDNADAATGSVQTAVFYGAGAYQGAQAQFDASVFINTPLTTDAQGNVFFGFVVTASNPAGLSGGIARIGADGTGSWIATTIASGNAAVTKPAMNSAPALSQDLQTLYVVVANNPPAGEHPFGYLLALDAATLATKGKVLLTDPKTGAAGWISDNGTASPAVSPDGDVYYGLLESNAPAHNFRGWLLHFNAALTQAKTPASFGWDDTPSFVPAAMVPSYAGTSSYLVVMKYNNYGGVGTGDGKNRMAVLDPNQAQVDTISGNQVMREVLTILGPTADADYPGGVREWCINTVAVDPVSGSVLVNNEDGILYRWSLASNTFTEQIRFNTGYAEAYTPTAIGTDGSAYSINDGILFSVGQASNLTIALTHAGVVHAG
ncbi:MAG: hypothetical protein ABI624_09590, partial [Casimicrobiaceae bacterium]